MLNALFVTETIAKTGMVMLLGEVTSKAHVDYQQVVRDAIEKIGYTHSSQGLALHRFIPKYPRGKKVCAG